MSEFICDANSLQTILDITKKISGNDLSSKKDILKNRIISFAAENSLPNVEALISRLSYNNPLRQDFLNLITINETYFFRELKQLKSVIDYANSSDGMVKILCAPCSSGEEVYSLGILAKSIGIDKFKLQIIGIDINSEVIEKCTSGIYTQRALQYLNEAQKQTYFTSVEDKFKIKKELMPRVEFKLINIFDDNIFKLGVFDMILSRNMLIYFDESYRLNAIQRFHKLLKPYGRLYVGHADLVPYTDIYKKITDFNTSYYEKL